MKLGEAYKLAGKWNCGTIRVHLNDGRRLTILMDAHWPPLFEAKYGEREFVPAGIDGNAKRTLKLRDEEYEGEWAELEALRERIEAGA